MASDSATSQDQPKLAKNVARIRRIFYITFILCVTGGFAFHMHRQFMKYLEDPTVGIRSKRNETTLFPDVTICYPGLFQKNARQGSVTCKDIFSNNLKILWQLALFNGTGGTLPADVAKDAHFSPSILSMTQSLISSTCSPYLTETLVYCQYNGKFCYFNNFTTYYSGDLGTCFQFSPSIYTVNSLEPKNGLIINMMKNFDYVNPQQLYTGFKVFIHPRNTWPDTRMVDTTVDASSLGILKFQYEYLKRINRPTSPCTNENTAILCRHEWLKGMKCKSYELTKGTQQLIAQQMTLYKDCQCVSYEWPIPYTLRNETSCHYIPNEAFLKTKLPVNAMRSTFISVFNVTLSSIVDFTLIKRRHLCYERVKTTKITVKLNTGAQPCILKAYDFTARSYNSFFSKIVTDVPTMTEIAGISLNFFKSAFPGLKNYTSLSPILNTIGWLADNNRSTNIFAMTNMASARIVVHPLKLGYTDQEEFYLYEFLYFLADIGGVTGLWIGMSVVTIFEMIEWIIRRVKRSCRKK